MWAAIFFLYELLSELALVEAGEPNNALIELTWLSYLKNQNMQS
jgi:hypothetical protein